MFLLPTKPLNSKTETFSEGNQVQIVWKNPRGGASRIFPSIFMLIWLCGWAFGMYMAVTTLMNGEFQIFLMIWLTGWSFGGFFAISMLVKILPPAKPEKLTFDTLYISYQKGIQPILFDTEQTGRRNSFNFPLSGKSSYHIPKTELGEIKLERIGDRQRLTIDHGAERIEIGAF